MTRIPNRTASEWADDIIGCFCICCIFVIAQFLAPILGGIPQ